MPCVPSPGGTANFSFTFHDDRVVSTQLPVLSNAVLRPVAAA